VSFGNLGLLDVGLICAAVLLSFGTRRSFTLSKPLSAREILRDRHYFLPPLGLGAATGVALSALGTSEIIAMWIIVAVAAGAGLAALVAADFWRSAAKRNPWDLVTVSVFLIAWSVASNVVALGKSPL
jgi:hypothetical protein